MREIPFHIASQAILLYVEIIFELILKSRARKREAIGGNQKE